jgi:hypothetical protein
MILGRLLPHPELVIAFGAVLDEVPSEKDTSDFNAEEVSQAVEARKENAWQEEVIYHISPSRKGIRYSACWNHTRNV